MSGSSDEVDGPASGGSEGQAPPVCYRHPERETYIQCARCGRYICPDCMIAAPVGFHCPECVKEGAKTVRQVRTPLGGEVVTRGDLITKILISVNVGVFLLGLVVGGTNLVGRFALVTVAGFEGEAIGVFVGDYYRLLSAAFVHTAFWHIGFNMYALWVLGSLLEPVLGRWRFLALYVLSALGGTTASLAFLPVGGVSYGASGAVFGLLGATLVILRRFGRDVTFVLVILGINVVLGFVVPGIDWRAHLGGLVTGTALALVFAHAPRGRRTAYGVAACIVVAVVIVVSVAGIVPELPVSGSPG